MRLGEIIRKARKIKGLKQKKLADSLPHPIRADQYRAYERGARKPKQARLKEIAAALEISFGMLDDGYKEPEVEIMKQMLLLEDARIEFVEKGTEISVKVKGMEAFFKEYKKAQTLYRTGAVSEEKYDLWKLGCSFLK